MQITRYYKEMSLQIYFTETTLWICVDVCMYMCICVCVVVGALVYTCV